MKRNLIGRNFPSMMAVGNLEENHSRESAVQMHLNFHTLTKRWLGFHKTWGQCLTCSRPNVGLIRHGVIGLSSLFTEGFKARFSGFARKSPPPEILAALARRCRKVRD